MVFLFHNVQNIGIKGIMKLILGRLFLMASYEIFITFGIYLLFLMAIGVYFYSKTTTHESYVLGDRGVGYWVTAMSAQASDMSGWLLLG